MNKIGFVPSNPVAAKRVDDLLAMYQDQITKHPGTTKAANDLLRSELAKVKAGG